MSEGDLPAVARYRLRVALREAREAKHLTQAQVAKELEWSLSKVNRIEAGEVTVSRTDLQALLQLYAITDAERIEDLVNTARASRARSWWDKPEFRARLTPAMVQLFQFVAVAEEIDFHESHVLPGFLQTPEYGEAVLDAYRGSLSEDQRAARLEARLQRRRSLFSREPPPQFRVLLDEALLLREIGGKGVMAKQLDELVRMAQWPNMELRLLPLVDGAVPMLPESFSIWRFGDEAALYRELVTGDEILFQADTVQTYQGCFSATWEGAMREEMSARLIEARAADLRAQFARQA